MDVQSALLDERLKHINALLKLVEAYREIHKDWHTVICKSLEEKLIDAEYIYEETIKR